jgi:predicted amidohydrolase
MLCSIVASFLLAEVLMSAPTTQAAPALKIAVCQVLCIDGDREGNFARIERALQQAAAGGAQIACLPESVILGWENPEAHQLAEPIPGKDSDRIAALAQRFKLMIAIGLDEKAGKQLYGSAILVDRDGRILLKHRKIDVLPDLMDPPYATGKAEDIGAAETRYGRIGMMICADTFREDHLKRMKALRPDLVLVPYGWAAPKEHWPGHAAELEKLGGGGAGYWQCPVVGTDLVGVIAHGPWKGRTYGGASVVADAAGRAAAVLADRDAEVRIVEVTLARR